MHERIIRVNGKRWRSCKLFFLTVPSNSQARLLEFPRCLNVFRRRLAQIYLGFRKEMKDFLPSTSWADQFCFQSFMSRFGECNKSTILSNTRPLTQGRLKACQDLVFRSSACEGHFSRMTFILIKAPTHNFQEICCRLGSHWNQICHRKQNVSFPSFAPKGHNCDILKASLDG